MTELNTAWNEVQPLRDRFLADPVPVRLGNLASTLARLSACAAHPTRSQLVYRLLTEAQYFIECTGPEAGPETRPQLARLQIELARWRRRWSADAALCSPPELAAQARAWSHSVLEWSGLLDEPHKGPR